MKKHAFKYKIGQKVKVVGSRTGNRDKISLKDKESVINTRVSNMPEPMYVLSISNSLAWYEEELKPLGDWVEEWE